MGQAMGSAIRYPHCVTETHLYIHVKSWGSALGASVLAKRFYPALKMELVSEDRLAALKKQEEEG